MNKPAIVFGDDHSAHADRAWLWINSQRWPGWTVDAVTAVREREDLVSDDLPIRLDEWKPDSPRTAFAETGITSVRHLRSTADPRLALDSCHDASLVVVGPRGAHGLRNLFLGSTADHLLRQPPAPLLVATTPNPATRVLVCTDGSPNASRALEVFDQLPLAANADHVAVIGVATPGICDDRDEIYGGVDAAAEVLSRLNPELIRAQSEGNVAGAILDHAVALRAQLVVVGTRGLTGLRRIVLGSTTNAVVRTAPCPVLVVPEEQISDDT